MIKNYYTKEKTVKEAVSELTDKINVEEVKAMVYFASSIYDQSLLASELNDKLTGVDVFGCSTAGELVNGDMFQHAIVAMTFDKEDIEDLNIEIIENLSNDLPKKMKKTFQSFSEHFGPLDRLSHKDYVGIVLTDGTSGKEEEVNDQIGNLTNIPFIGGSAGDDLNFQSSFVYANGKVYENATLLALLKPKRAYEIVKTQSFTSLNKTLTATKVDEKNRTVIEFDHQPAAEAYANMLGISKETLADHFMTNPVGLKTGEDFYVRSPQQLNGDSIVFYCNILEGMEVELLQSTNIIEDTKKSLGDLRQEASGIIDFQCILRALELRGNNKTKAYGEIYSVPTIGFATYGESYIGHINQTSTILVFE